MYELKIRDTFSGAHSLREYQGKCENMHGHNWVVLVYVRGVKLQHNGMLIDFKVMKQYLEKVLDLLDHQNLNELPPFDKLNPSCEHLSKFIFEKFESLLTAKGNPNVAVHKVEVFETEYSSACYCKSE